MVSTLNLGCIQCQQVWLNVGYTAVFREHADAYAALVGPPPPGANEDLSTTFAVATAARKLKYDTIQCVSRSWKLDFSGT